MNHSSIKPIISSALLLLALFSTHANAVKLYKWVDAEGKVSYQDQPPPSGQAFEEKSFTEQGTSTGVNPDVSRSRAIREKPIVLYVADNCESCDMVRTILEMNDAPFEQIAVDSDIEKQDELKKIAGSIRVPTVTIGGQEVKQLDRKRIEDALRQNGYLGIKDEIQ